ncbi:MAG: DegT/DnrJ/EryC1/StrS aminotransferase family protein [Candidatus Lokiarchaeota archaeon]|nr:DegT/DnrJ/EryC1/StrS aminotransferase family protein [Candidatus Lokiarchaeota archaeon]
MKKTYPLFDIYWDEEDIQRVNGVIRRGTSWAAGPEIIEFENALKTYFGVKYALTFNSGTSAMHALMLAHGINSGEVIVPSFSFISTANAVLLAGATPVFADIESESLGLDPMDVEGKISSNTEAIVPMHYGGRVCKNIEKLRTLADTHNLLLIEDNAESFGASLNGKLAGTFGQSAFLSFCQNKIITTGEGGAVITNDENVYQNLILIRSHGRVEKNDVDYFHDTEIEDYIAIGYNLRMPSICAALGVSQLKKISTIISKRREVALYYNQILSEIKNISIFHENSFSTPVYQLFSILLNNPTDRAPLQKFLVENGIYTKIYFAPIHQKKFYAKKFPKSKGLSVTIDISRRILTLPFSLNFQKEDLDFIADKIREFFKDQQNKEEIT